MKHHILILLQCTLKILSTASSVAWNIKFIKYRENKLTVTRYVQNIHHWHEHKHTSVLAIGQLRHQSATARVGASPHMQQTLSPLTDNNVIMTSYLRYM